jgi:hypothetical protein
MAINRTIYTSSEVKLLSGAASSLWAVVSGVQNASVSFNSPNQPVNTFGSKGIIDNVQVEPETATATFSFILPQATGNGNHISPDMLNQLIQNSLLDSPAPIHVSVAAIGLVASGFMSSFSINAAVGDLPTCEMTFEGVPSGGIVGNDTDAELPDKIAPVAAVTYNVLTPDRVSGLGVPLTDGGNPASNDIAGFGASVQSTTFSWDIPVERVMSLGLGPSRADTFPNPPGTASITAQGMDMPINVTGLIVGEYKLWLGPNAKVSSRENNLAVGDIGATYSVTVESTADSCVVSKTTA